VRSANKLSTVSKSKTEICDIGVKSLRKNVTAHYHLVYDQRQTAFCRKILIFHR